MAANGDDEIALVDPVSEAEGTDGNETTGRNDDGDENRPLNSNETTGWFRRVKKCLKGEHSRLCRCIQSASPDRSSAAVLFLLLFAGSLTCTLSHYLTASQPQSFPNYVVMWVIIGFEVVATASLVAILCKAGSRPSGDVITDDDLQPWHRFIRRNMKLFGIIPFYFAILVFDTFHATAVGRCNDARLACDGGDVRREHITDLIYPIVRVIYLCVMLIVCVKFNEAHFNQNTLVLAGLAIVQATNLSIWLDALLHESDVFSSERNGTYEKWRCFDGSDVNVSDHFDQCFNRTTDEYQLLTYARPYLYPFIMEYLMLVIECVADWFFSDARRHDGTAPSTVASASSSRQMSATQHESNTADGGMKPTQTDVEVEQPPQRAEADDFVTESNAEGRQDDNVQENGARRDTPTPTTCSQSGFEHVDNTDNVPETWYDRCPCFFVSVVLSLIASFVLVILGIYNLYHDDIVYRNVFTCYRSAYWLALSLAALVGYAASRCFLSEPMNPNGFEYFVILSSIGPIMQSIFTTVAAVGNVGFLPTGMFLTEEITNILQICSQVVFYAYAKSIQIKFADDKNNDDRELGRKRSILIAVISHFAICNAFIWVVDSFIEIHSSATSWQKLYFDKWPLIYHIFNPLALVFRFNSVFLFLNVLFDKQPSSRSKSHRL